MKANKKIALYAVLIAIESILCLISNYISFSNVNINLSLIIIAIAAFMLGPIGGLVLGLVNGVFALIAPGTMIFITYSPLFTIIICLLKTGIGGLIAGLIGKSKIKNGLVKAILAALLIPLINTGIYLIGCLTIFKGIYEALNTGNIDVVEFILVSVLATNFLIEIVVTVSLSPIIERIISLYKEENRYGN